MGFEVCRLKTGHTTLFTPVDRFFANSTSTGDDRSTISPFGKRTWFHVNIPEQVQLSLVVPMANTHEIQFWIVSTGKCMLCHLHNAKDAEIIRANLHKSPLYAGVIEGSAQDIVHLSKTKIVKFPEKKRHQLFLEPEGVATEEIYVNGFSTSFATRHSIRIGEDDYWMRACRDTPTCYAVEYDFVPPTSESNARNKNRRNLFHAGQINGTSGYEEAAAQGILAGINAACRVKGKEPLFCAAIRLISVPH